MAEELGLGVNDKEFEEAQAQSKEASKATLKSGAKNAVKLDVHDIGALEKNEGVPKTDDSSKYGGFLQYCSQATLIYPLQIKEV